MTELIKPPGLIIGEAVRIHGRYLVECFDRFGDRLWDAAIDNVVCVLGKNFVLDSALSGAAYTVTGPYMGLISGTSFTGVSSSDTMTSHAGWLEAGGANSPTYAGSRPTCTFNAAAAGTKIMTGANLFSMSQAGTIEGCFIVLGPGAAPTKDTTTGTLLSAGVFSGGAQTVAATNSLSVTYQLSI